MLNSINMTTAANRHIVNEQSYARMTALRIQQLRDAYLQDFPNNIERTMTPTGVYNCHGLLFASRRTQIDGKSIRPILHDDKYIRINRKDDVKIGDIVLFVAPDGDIEHSAIVVVPPSESITGMPKVFSKWGPFTEFIHYANFSPYDVTNLEYWRVEWP